MYTLLELTSKVNLEWVVIPDRHIKISEVLTKHADSFINVTNLDTDTTEQFNVRAINNIGAYTDQYLDDWIDSYIYNLGTPVVKSRSISRPNKVTYSNLFDLGLTANRSSFEYSASDIAPLQSEIDIAITPVDSQLNNMELLESKYMYLVNGSVQPTVTHANTTYLLNATRLLADSHQQLSVIDFTAVGGYSKLSIKLDQVKVHSRTDTSTTLHVTLAEPLADVSPILVVNGKPWLHLKGYRFISDTLLVVVVNHLDVISNIRGYTADELPWVSSANLRGDGWNVASLDARLLLADPSSWLALVPGRSLSIYQNYVNRTTIPGRYTYPIIPNGVLLDSNNNVLDYVVSAGNMTEVELSTTLPRSTRLLSGTVKSNQLTSVSNSSAVDLDLNRDMRLVSLYTL